MLPCVVRLDQRWRIVREIRKNQGVKFEDVRWLQAGFGLDVHQTFCNAGLLVSDADDREMRLLSAETELLNDRTGHKGGFGTRVEQGAYSNSTAARGSQFNHSSCEQN